MKLQSIVITYLDWQTPVGFVLAAQLEVSSHHWNPRLLSPSAIAWTSEEKLIGNRLDRALSWHLGLTFVFDS